MEKQLIDFEDFELQFLTAANESNENDEEEVSANQIKENMESLIPNQTIFLGTLETEVNNWTSWSIKDDYYIYPLINEQFDWALFRITWDDNWGSWQWSFDARIKGFKDNPNEAARSMIGKLWKKWHINLKVKYNQVYVQFLKEI